ncbi:MAG TPA: FAD-dependent oxidoreductase, partial [Polyangiaceae bacterium]|nr:FAD-dependent oxidoreductase [Polyangiaceae bacterium]
MAKEGARIAVVGGGLAGLVAAFRLRHDAAIEVLEAGDRFGGQIDTLLADGFVVERGAEGFVARSSALPLLAEDLGLAADELIDQATLRSYGYDAVQLSALEPGEAARFLGFQVAREDLGRGIRSLRHGMGSLITALEQALRGQPGATLRAATQVRAVERAERGLQLVLADGTAVRADAVLIATPAVVAAELLAGLAGEPARALRSAITSSSVTVELAYPSAAVSHPLDGSGFVVALAAQQEGLRACTWSSSKFEGRAPVGKVALRAFFRPSPEDLAQLDDAAWVERARRGLARVMGVQASPLHAWVSRWRDALPVFDDAHRARVAALEQALRPWPIALAG